MNKLKIIMAGMVAAYGCSANQPCPNVIVVMTDDQGYDDFSSHGNPIVRTPRLDAFREQSVRIPDFHSAPMSTATRGQLLTGIDALRNGAANVSSGRTQLGLEFRTAAQYFADAGYSTALFGKWHLGDSYPYRPEDRGFEETLWFPSSHIGSIPDHWGNDCFDDCYIHNGSEEEVRGYCTDVFFTRAADWVKGRVAERKPFFLYLAPNAPHGPFHAPDSCVASVHERMKYADSLGVKSKRMGDLEIYLAMIESVDHNFGLLLDSLDSLGVAENTIVLFMTDNGSVLDSYVPHPNQRGKKGQMLEGGHRVPFFFRYPAALEGGRDLKGLAQMQDVLPTLLDFCNIKYSRRSFDGMSLAEVLSGKKEIPTDRSFCIDFSPMPTMFAYPSPYGQAKARNSHTAVLQGRWRLLGGKELYDLDSDPMQLKDVSSDHPEIVASMREISRKWWSSIPDPDRMGITWVGAPESPCVKLTACEWVNVFTDQQSQVVKGTRRNSYTLIDVREAGRYRFELRRYPREYECAAGASYAKIFISGLDGSELDSPLSATRKISPEDSCAVFEFDLPKGPVALHTWFDDSQREPLYGAYYVYVEKL